MFKMDDEGKPYVGLIRTPSVWCRYCGCRFASQWKYKKKICIKCYNNHLFHDKCNNKCKQTLLNKMFEDGDPSKQYKFGEDQPFRPYRPLLCQIHELAYLEEFINANNEENQVKQYKTRSYMKSQRAKANHDKISDEIESDDSDLESEATGIKTSTHKPTSKLNEIGSGYISTYNENAMYISSVEVSEEQNQQQYKVN